MASLTLLPSNSAKLEKIYERAFERARELYVVSAYLTNWNSDLKLSRGCKVKIIIGKDFGITRKEACKQVLKWLPSNCKHSFYVAAYIGGFHPKAMFWKERDGKCYSLVGSSNLTEAAFKSNYEANLYSQVNSKTYQDVTEWVGELIEHHSRPVDPKWLAEYKEARLVGKKTGGSPDISNRADDFPLPEVTKNQVNKALNYRRQQVKAFAQIREPLKRLFLDGAFCKPGGSTPPAFCRDGNSTSVAIHARGIPRSRLKLPLHGTHGFTESLPRRGRVF
jgi:HKD family nuclease